MRQSMDWYYSIFWIAFLIALGDALLYGKWPPIFGICIAGYFTAVYTNRLGSRRRGRRR